MRKTLLMLGVLVLLLAACGGIGVEREILGTWESEGSLFSMGQIAEFTRDKELILSNAFGLEERLAYAIIAPGNMRLEDAEGERVIAFRLEGDQLDLDLETGWLSFTRAAPPAAVSEPEPERQPESESAEQPASPAAVVPTARAASQNPSGSGSSGSSSREEAAQAPVLAASGAFITPTPREYYPLQNCASSQLHVGDSAFISWHTTPNALRTTPDTHPSNNFVDDGRVPPGGVLEVLDGPVCNYGWVLWYVRTTWDVEGWTPETDGREYWMLPIATRHLCKDSKPTRLIAGQKAFVEEEPNDPVEVYRVMEATINDPASILYRIPVKEQVDLLEGPFCDGKGANWWRVRTQTNVEGYIRENDKIKDYYFMAPVP